MSLKPLEANRERVGDNMVLARKCRVTHELATLTVTIVEYYRWKGGELSQNVWPNLTPDEREFIQTGYTQAEWESIFSSSDEEETDEDREDREREEQEEEDHYYETREGRPADEDDPRGFFPSDIDAGVETTDEEDEVDQEALDRERKAHESMLQRHEERRPQRERDLEDDLFRRDRGFA